MVMMFLSLFALVISTGFCSVVLDAVCAGLLGRASSSTPSDRAGIFALGFVIALVVGLIVSSFSDTFNFWLACAMPILLPSLVLVIVCLCKLIGAFSAWFGGRLEQLTLIGSRIRTAYKSHCSNCTPITSPRKEIEL